MPKVTMTVEFDTDVGMVTSVGAPNEMPLHIQRFILQEGLFLIMTRSMKMLMEHVQAGAKKADIQIVGKMPFDPKKGPN